MRVSIILLRGAMPFCAILLCCIISLQAASKNTLSAAEQEKAIGMVRNYALSYTRRLPDYTCMQTTRQTAVRALPSGRVNTITNLVEEQLSFVNKREIRRVTRVNGIAVSSDLKDDPMSRGEFGNFLDVIFDPATGADLKFDRMETFHRHAVYVLAFHVSQANGYGLVESRRTTRVPFEGLVFADSDDGAVVRIEMKCIDIPRDSEYTSAELKLDYKSTRVAGAAFLLPSGFLLHFRLASGGGLARDAVYSGYRRFSADSSIQFDPQ